jgi:hypothetical protein
MITLGLVTAIAVIAVIVSEIQDRRKKLKNRN